MKFFGNIDINEEHQRDVAFQSLVAMRDTLNIATKAPQPPTYEQSLRMFYDLNSEIYHEFDKLLSEKNDNDTVKFYKELATLESIKQKRQVEPIELIKKQIDEYEKLKTEVSKQDTKYINGKIVQLCSALKNLEPRHLSENAILNQDVFHTDREYCGEKIVSDCKFVDYALSGNRFLRIRFLHPDNAEHITGADLVYEQINLETNKLRFIFLQYKTWNNGHIYFSQTPNLMPQLEKLQATLCKNGFCKHPDNNDLDYRFPYCCGFLRPTDKLQHKNSKMVSSGLHIPICNILKHKEKNGLFKKELKNFCITHKIFEEMFNLNLIGSRWLDISEIESFYKEKSIIEPYDTVKLHAKEIISYDHNEDE